MYKSAIYSTPPPWHPQMAVQQLKTFHVLAVDPRRSLGISPMYAISAH